MCASWMYWTGPVKGDRACMGVRHIWPTEIHASYQAIYMACRIPSHQCASITTKDGYDVIGTFFGHPWRGPFLRCLHHFRFRACRERPAPHVIFKHRARAQRVLRPRAPIAPPHRDWATEFASHPLLFAPSVNAPTPSLFAPRLCTLRPLVRRQRRVRCLSAPLTQPAAATPDAPIACSPAFFRKEQAMLSLSDIPGRPETQVGREVACDTQLEGRTGEGGPRR